MSEFQVRDNLKTAVASAVAKNVQTPDCGFTSPEANKDSNQFETFFVANLAGPRLNVPINLKTPRRSITFLGSDGGGSGIGIFISFQPFAGTGQTPPPPTIMSLNGFVLVAGLPVVFRYPISQFFISFSDSGQPGTNYYFRMTNDLMIAGNELVTEF
jgi:hypothetical protein